MSNHYIFTEDLDVKLLHWWVDSSFGGQNPEGFCNKLSGFVSLNLLRVIYSTESIYLSDLSGMGEDKLHGDNRNSFSNGHPEPVSIPPQINHVYQSSPDVGSVDTFLTPEASSGRKKVENINASPIVDKDGSNKQPDESKVHIDTAAPFESVKEVVSRFGAINDWKAHKAQTNERRKFIDQELGKAQDEIPVFKKKSEEAKKEKDQALRDLDSTKRLIQELKLNLERSQTEEYQAKQDSELAQLRVQELEQGITDGDSSVAAKTQLEVAKARHLEAAEELVSAKKELEETRKDYGILASERDAALQKAQEVVSTDKENEREVENLTIQLITTKESIESTHQELKRSEEELEKMKQRIVVAKDLKSKLETASNELRKLKDELANYMQGKMGEKDVDDDKFTRKDIQSGVAIAKKNLTEVNHTIERTNEEIMCLKSAEKSLLIELESEKQVLTNDRKQMRLGTGAVVNLESDLQRSRLELDNIRKKEKEAREKLVELPKRLQKVSEETENAKLLAEGASLVLKRAKEGLERAKTGVSSVSSRLDEIQKKIEAARAKEKLALGAISALHESARGSKREDPKGGVRISLGEYYDLSKRAHEAQEAGDKRVADAMAMIDEAKDSEMQSLNKLTQLNSELAARKEALNVALQKAKMAKECKLNFEEELKIRKGENDSNQESESWGGSFHALSRKASEKVNHDSSSHNSGASGDNKSNTKSSEPENDSSHDVKGLFKDKKKKKMRVIMPMFSLMTTGKWIFHKKDNS
ncbi:protein WEAK CHLOROPLAST MOVEMENT UNDER BLUE LIGHT 1-like [Rutidosis leptorrhynchoides]|uniref:protein WEAK CHLOROPLAST MOVEMENT UNDER BLUE LIGHT 1-like n=1 Tax=Rutidosis leptorrhynchoides TaxID=125765 RepID=UPI003A9933F3